MSNHEQLFAEIIPREEANLSGGMGRINAAEAEAKVKVIGGDFNQAIALTDARSTNNKFVKVNSALAVAFGAGIDVADVPHI